MRFIQCLLAGIFYTGFVLGQAPARPFPQHTVYYPGVIKPSHISQQRMDDSVRSFYTAWKERYVNDDCGPGQYYIWYELPGKQCVSEGQGYGMIIVAMMAGFDTAAKTTYDGLFRYYKAHPSRKSPYLMAWAQTKNCRDLDRGSATDGDMDIAWSLLLADRQWGSAGAINYREEARGMISAILQQEVNRQTFSVLLGNDIEADSKDYFDMRSSDFMPAHFKSFAKAGDDTSWNRVVDASYRLFHRMQADFSPDAGLVPDFIQHVNKKPVPARAHYLESKYDGAYNYNACRVPWRVATDFILYGDGRSKSMVEKINRWVRGTTKDIPDNISAGYSLGGNDLPRRYFEAGSFIASFAVSAMVSGDNQAWLNSLWDYTVSFDLDQFDYYDNSIKMIGLLLLSGNYWGP
ncbi:MAG TPA: glycosyl hydrolase family 8 [Chitinophagaceae bacterium]|jgi:endo-1,4-beta-D-glucanase Y